MRGNTRKKRLLSKRKTISQLPSSIIEPGISDESSMGRPVGSLGLRAALIKDHCGPTPTRTQLELISAYCALDDLRKGEEGLKPQTLLSVLTSQKGILKMLQDFSGKQSGNSPSGSGSDWDELSLDDQKYKSDEMTHLLGITHKHTTNGGLVEVKAGGSKKLHQSGEPIESRQTRRLNREGKLEIQNQK